jgi:hypothetical protein
MPLADVVHESLLDGFAHGDGERDLAALALVSMRRAGAEEAPGVTVNTAVSEQREAASPGGEAHA